MVFNFIVNWFFLHIHTCIHKRSRILLKSAILKFYLDLSKHEIKRTCGFIVNDDSLMGRRRNCLCKAPNSNMYKQDNPCGLVNLHSFKLYICVWFTKPECNSESRNYLRTYFASILCLANKDKEQHNKKSWNAVRAVSVLSFSHSNWRSFALWHIECRACAWVLYSIFFISMVYVHMNVIYHIHSI